jgi:hypothetical protein
VPFSLIVFIGLSGLAQLDDSPLAPPPTVVEPAPIDDSYVEITRVGQPVAPAVYHAPVVSPQGYYPVAPANAVPTNTVQRPIAPPQVERVGPITAADIPPTLTGPTIAPTVPLAPNQVPANPGVPTSQSLFTNGYGGTRAYAVTLPPAAPIAPAAPYQPITAPVAVQPVAPGVYIGRGIVGQPKLYAPHRPVRNFFRWLTP